MQVALAGNGVPIYVCSPSKPTQLQQSGPVLTVRHLVGPYGAQCMCYMFSKNKDDI